MKLAPNPGGMHMTQSREKSHKTDMQRKEDSHKVYKKCSYMYTELFRKIIFEGKDTNINDVNTNRKKYTTQAAQSTTKKIISLLSLSLCIYNIHLLLPNNPENV